MLTVPVGFNFWRAMTDNDRGWEMDKKMQAWQADEADYELSAMTARKEASGDICLESSYLFRQTHATAVVRHLVRPDGSIQVYASFDVPTSAPHAPQIGLTFGLPASLSQIAWYGRGPYENYIDRLQGSAVGIYRSSLADWVTPYVRPQDNANRTGIRWITFADEPESSLLFAAIDRPFQCSAWPYMRRVLEQATHDDELLPADYITVNIHCARMGVGGDTSWGSPVMDKYHLHPGVYQYTFLIQGK